MVKEYLGKEQIIEILSSKEGTEILNHNTFTAIRLISLVKEAPSADVEEVRHGQWLPQIVSGVKAWDCSECKTLGSPHWKRCPICEAKMDGGENE